MATHWYLFKIYKQNVLVHLNSVPILQRSSEDSDDYLRPHPEVIRRATIFLSNKYGPEYTYTFVNEVFPYGGTEWNH